MSELMTLLKPDDWISVLLEDIVFFQEGPGLRKYQYGDDTGIPFLNIRTFDNGKINKKKCNFIKKEEFENKYEHFLLNEGDLVVSSSGTIGKSVTVKKEDLPIMLNTSVIRFRTKNENILLQSYLKYFLRSENFLDQINLEKTGICISNYGPTHLKKVHIIFPSLHQQKRIVDKIEELFSELDNVKSTLKNTQLQLEQYKQSLLKFSFEGKLTKKWRQEHNPSLENVLKNIEDGKRNQNKKLQNIVSDESDFFEIPDKWKWIKVGNVSKKIQYGTSEKATITKSKIPVLRMGNIQDGTLDFSKLKYYPNDWKHFKTFELVDGDVLFNRTNSAELVGKTAVYYNHCPSAVFAGYLIRIKLFENTYIPSLLSNYINSIFGKLYIRKVVTQQVGQANVNSTKLTMIPLPLMSFEEQKEIHSKLELYFSLIKNTENTVNSLLSKLETLYSTILKKTFEGKLVLQDPNDEPAEILLQKIKQEKEQCQEKIKQEKQQLIQKQKTSRSKKNVK